MSVQSVYWYIFKFSIIRPHLSTIHCILYSVIHSFVSTNHQSFLPSQLIYSCVGILIFFMHTYLSFTPPLSSLDFIYISCTYHHHHHHHECQYHLHKQYNIISSLPVIIVNLKVITIFVCHSLTLSSPSTFTTYCSLINSSLKYCTTKSPCLSWAHVYFQQ